MRPQLYRSFFGRLKFNATVVWSICDRIRLCQPQYADSDRRAHATGADTFDDQQGLPPQHVDLPLLDHA
jgi:hypothetical protein